MLAKGERTVHKRKLYDLKGGVEMEDPADSIDIKEIIRSLPR